MMQFITASPRIKASNLDADQEKEQEFDCPESCGDAAEECVGIEALFEVAMDDAVGRDDVTCNGD